MFYIYTFRYVLYLYILVCFIFIHLGMFYIYTFWYVLYIYILVCFIFIHLGEPSQFYHLLTFSILSLAHFSVYSHLCFAVSLVYRVLQCSCIS